MGGGERGGEHSLTVLLRSPSSSCARRGFLLDSPRLELAPLPPRGRDRDTEAGKREREREAEKELRGEEGKYRVQATETSRRRNDRKTEVARGTFRRLRTHSRRPAAEVHEAGSSRRVNRTPTFDDVHTIKKTTIPLCLPILSRSTDILKEWRVPQRYRLPFSSKLIFASEDKYNMNGYKDGILR